VGGAVSGRAELANQYRQAWPDGGANGQPVADDATPDGGLVAREAAEPALVSQLADGHARPDGDGHARSSGEVGQISPRHATPTVLPRLGFLGLGWIGECRRAALVAAGVAEVAGIADPAGGGALGSLDELLDLDLDGVVIATPSALHAEQAIAALEAGVAVFCQKPLARTREEAAAVVGAARAADRLLGVDLSYRHARAFAAAVQLVRSGELGEIVAADLAFHNAYGPDKGWFYEPALAGGGCVIDLGLHLVDLALEALDRRTFADGAARLVGAPVEQYATAQLDQVRIACSWNLHAGRDAVIEATFFGTAGGVSVANVGGSFFDFRAERFTGTQRTTLVEPPDDWGGRAAVAWAERLARDTSFDAEIERVVDVHAVIDRIYEART
jgi:predicted dehydrogenase